MVTVKLNRKFSLFFILAFLLINSTFSLFSQEYSIRVYGVKDGLPQSQGSIIFQDSKGFLWISTGNGLSRFDGTEFVNYFRKDGLPSNFVFQIIEDPAHDLYALTINGLSKYTGDGFLFYPPGPGFDKSVSFGHAAASSVAGENYILYNKAEETVSRIASFRNGTYKDYSRGFTALDTMRFREICYDTASSDLLLIDSGLNLWAWKDEALFRISDKKLSEMHYDRGRILVTSGDSVLEYADRKLKGHQTENKEGRPEVWISVSDKMNILNFFNGSATLSMPLDFRITKVFIDRDGTLWFNTENNVYRLLSSAFTTLSNEELRSKNIWAICKDKAGHLWLGSLYGDLYEYDGAGLKRRDDYKTFFPLSCAFYKGSRLLANGEMWLSTNLGILIWDGSFFSRYKGIPDNTQICYIYEDPVDNKILIGTGTGLYSIDKGSVTLFPRFHDGDLGVIEGITRDDAGFYWLSGHRGVVKLDGSNAIPVKEDILPEAFTYNIDKDSRGGIWVSTDEGLFLKRSSDQFFRHGLPYKINSPANTLKILDNSFLLVGRAADICLIDLDRFYNGEKDYYRIYDQSDGYPGGDCLDNGIIKNTDGSVWILTTENVIQFRKDKIIRNPIPPALSITGLYYETDSLTWEPVETAELYIRLPSGLTLGRDQSKIRITFSGISTSNPEKVQYMHRLAGRENNWSLPSLKREVSYDHLPPGRYLFLLKAINSDGVETADPLILNFRIKPAVWETTLFKIISVLTVLIVTALVTWQLFRRGLRQKEEKQKVKSELQKLQISSVLNQLDPHFTFNAISSIGYLIMKNNREEAYSYLTRLSSLLRTILYDGSSIIRTLSEELDFVTNYCELQKLRFGRKFSYNITIGDNVDPEKEIPKMAIQTFVENSIKHGFENRKKGGKVDILLSRDNRFLEIVIRDNGIGREASMNLKTGGSGHGITTVRKIFGIMNHYNSEKASVEIIDLTDNGSVIGTEVRVRVPDLYLFTIGT